MVCNVFLRTLKTIPVMCLMSDAFAESATATEHFELSCCFQPVNVINVYLSAILFFMAIYALAVIVERWTTYITAKRQSEKFSPKLFKELNDNRVEKAIGMLEQYDKSHRARVILAGLREWQACLGIQDVAVKRCKRAMRRAADSCAEEFKRKLAPLMTVAWMAPLLGLCAAMLNLIDACESIYWAEGYIIYPFARGLSDALYDVASGLIIAAPTLWMYSKLKRRVRQLTVEMKQSASELKDYLLKKESGPTLINPVSSTAIIEQKDVAPVLQDQKQNVTVALEESKQAALWLFLPDESRSN